MKWSTYTALWCALASACATGQSATPAPVIVAGSVCSGLPGLPLEAAGAAASPASGGSIAYVVPGARPSLVVFDSKTGRERFRVAAALRGRPEVLNDVVVASDERGQLLGFDLGNGKLRFAVAIGRPSWLGAAQIDDRIVFTSTSLSFRPSERGSTVQAIDSRTGANVWRRDVPFLLGRPHAFGARVVMLSDHADVWALDAGSGADVGCLRNGGEPVDWLIADRAGLIAGAKVARRLAPSGAGPTNPLAPALSALPARPALHPSDYDAVPATRSAYGRVGVVAAFEPSGPGTPKLANDAYAFVFYRDVFGYDANGRLRWARAFDSDVVRAQRAGAQLWVATEGGMLFSLDAGSGALKAQWSVGTALASADLSAAVPVAAQRSTPPTPLRQSLAEIALDPDARLLPARLLAVRLLAQRPEPEATRDLLHVYTAPQSPEPLRKRIAAVLKQRRLGREYLIDALLSHYDFLDDLSPPPLAAILPALVAAHETRAVPRLVDCLFAPDTPIGQLPALVRAIAALGGPSAKAPLEKFLAMYHADSALSADPTALGAAARALVSLEPQTTQPLVEHIATDANTLPELRAMLARLLQRPAAEPPSRVVKQAPQPSAAELPETLSDRAVRKTMVEHAGTLRGCILDELSRNPGLRRLRLSFVVDHTGSYGALQIFPHDAELEQCLRVGLLRMRFPPFRSGRRLSTYTVAVHPEAAADESKSQLSAQERPFWALSERRADGSGAVVAGVPWWKDRNPLFVSLDADTAEAATAVGEPNVSAPNAPRQTPKRPQDRWWLPAQPDRTPAAESKQEQEDRWWLPAQPESSK